MCMIHYFYKCIFALLVYSFTVSKHKKCSNARKMFFGSNNTWNIFAAGAASAAFGAGATQYRCFRMLAPLLLLRLLCEARKGEQARSGLSELN